MADFRVQLDEHQRPSTAMRAPAFATVNAPRRRFRRVLGITAGTALVLMAIAGLGLYLYYQSFKDTPQYSLALLVDAAKRDDQQTVNDIIDIDAVVEDFMPQILRKAIELYGRGAPQPVIDNVSKLVEPLMPAVKDRARAQLARVIRDRTERYGRVPFFMMVFAADRYLNIEVTGDTAIVRSIENNRLELKMRRDGDRWRVVGINDDQLATDIARTIGQQLMEFAVQGLTQKAAEAFGLGNLAELLRRAESLVR
jgi:hypothetical protein